ncbi:thioredoxin-like protein YdbP [Thalassobacillus devorans]|uniref:Thioredoxin-like protein YdbP n=1 Tax=Thalassobacillus devorans TaxID=279813 RepID=A0ABQ1PQT2_9BACI|nr:thioredoxin family protein [Thalassobacillus devorans]NIK30300.1 thiol-disulfide isomerase/thioredoxin [Thalassobacillus devorans]GGD01345.1 thioredoxin-like protein YdbP [Thalassobacillus devorans]
METIQTTEVFYQIVDSEEPVIIKFEADWCPDCKRMDMFIGDIVEEYNQYQWYVINRDELPEIGNRYEVMGIPSILLFQNGEKQAHLHSADAKTPEEVQEFLHANL